MSTFSRLAYKPIKLTFVTMALGERRPSNRFRMQLAWATLVMVALAGLSAPPASALPPVGTKPPGHGIITKPPDPCGAGPQIVSFNATASRVQLGELAALSWQVQNPPPRCPFWVAVNGQQVGSEGTLSVQPFISGDDGIYRLTVTWGPALEHSLQASTTVDVDLPLEDPRCEVGHFMRGQPQVCRHAVTINQSYEVPLFVKALGTSNTTVGVAVDLDLSNVPTGIWIADGVKLIGGRQAIPGTPYQPGPRLHTVTAADPATFVTEGNNVRISGVRLEGPGLTDGYTRAIQIAPGPSVPSVSIEIDHNEIFNWNTAGVDISDPSGKILVLVETDHRVTPAELRYSTTNEPVWIHDNNFHNNYDGDSRHFGYGVVVGEGAHALIERNVFNAHWHAIAGDGTPRTGYRAYRNLVLESGYRTQGSDHGEQQFDMHHRRDGNQHAAGNDIDIRYNTFLYTDGPAVKLVGTPDAGAVVESNVFAHSSLSDAVWWEGNGVREGASCEGARPSANCGPLDNKVGVGRWDQSTSCDFDGDGINDLFIATGETLWYRSGDLSKGATPWVYLTTYPKHLNEFSLGYYSGRHVCDVVDNGWKLVGGTESWVPLIPLTGGGGLVRPPINGAQ